MLVAASVDCTGVVVDKPSQPQSMCQNGSVLVLAQWDNQTWEPYCTSGQLVEVPVSYGLCANGSWQSADGAGGISSIEPAQLLEYFSVGFSIVLMFWVLGKSASLVLSMIRR